MSIKQPYNGFVVAGCASGAGKTLITLGIMEALQQRGLFVAPFKAGPDYIDAGQHAAVLGRPSYNLDTWMMGSSAVKRTFETASKGADVSIIEGVMGLYDGANGRTERGSTAHLAKLLKLPVILVVDASKSARSAGAVIKGFAAFDKAVDIRWMIFNRVGSEKHLQILKDSIPTGLGARYLGFMPRDERLAMPQRHLGLVAADELERVKWHGLISTAAQIINESIDIDRLLKGLRMGAKRVERPPKFIKTRVSIGVARDAASTFYYEENLELLRKNGAALIFFSPLNDRRLPEGISGLYLGGGYPELFAAGLEANRSMRSQIKALSRKGLPIFAECGGLMYLGKRLVDTDGKKFNMTGVFPWTTRMLTKRAALGYREVEVSSGCPMLKQGGRIKGHEFHYSAMNEPERIKDAVFRLKDGRLEGFTYKNCLATYIHLHFASNPAIAKGFVRLCETYQKEKTK
ncbi:MAG: hypothetical protein A3J24_00215 [Deltaproteobacteria bacterium RIFCSPLOWO2_02_FULL_53_8]|nr:MAG: hypothetical protein A3J24_00215 [Deltaproteobacteria bacterium RIFCSPLOWO2_02_FULL_53_8]